MTPMWAEVIALAVVDKLPLSPRQHGLQEAVGFGSISQGATASGLLRVDPIADHQALHASLGFWAFVGLKPCWVVAHEIAPELNLSKFERRSA